MAVRLQRFIRGSLLRWHLAQHGVLLAAGRIAEGDSHCEVRRRLGKMNKAAGSYLAEGLGSAFPKGSRLHGADWKIVVIPESPAVAGMDTLLVSDTEALGYIIQSKSGDGAVPDMSPAQV